MELLTNTDSEENRCRDALVVWYHKVKKKDSKKGQQPDPDPGMDAIRSRSEQARSKPIERVAVEANSTRTLNPSTPIKDAVE